MQTTGVSFALRCCSAYLGRKASRIVFALFCEAKRKRRDTLPKEIFALVLTIQNSS